MILKTVLIVVSIVGIFIGFIGAVQAFSNLIHRLEARQGEAPQASQGEAPSSNED